MEPYAATAPARSLSADQQAAVAAFYKPRVGALLGYGLVLPLILGLLAALAFGIATDLNDLAAYEPLALGAGLAAIVLAQLLLRWNSRRKVTRAEFIYQHGQPESVAFVGLTSGYNRQYNRSQTIINLLRGTESLQIKTFDDLIIAAFMRPQQLVYAHPRYPDVLVPGSLFAPGHPAGPAPRPRVMDV